MKSLNSVFNRRHRFKAFVAIIVLGLLIFLFWTNVNIGVTQVRNGEAENSKTLTANQPEAQFDPSTIFRDGPILNLTQNDTRLLSYIRQNHVFPPSDLPYNLGDPTGDPTQKYGKLWSIAYKLLGNKTKGFFIECGALDGEFLSNTLVLERDFGWSGLLVEVDPVHVKQLFTKHRKAWIADTCLSLQPFPQEIKMQRHKEWGGLGRIVDPDIPKIDSNFDEFTAKCFPLFSILSAIEVLEIDYFSLDVEMAELQVLKTIPFDSVLIKVFSMEVFSNLATADRLFMESKGYVCLMFVQAPFTHDFVFIHKSLYKEGMIDANRKCK